MVSLPKLLRDLDCNKCGGEIEGFESEYNTLISHNEDQDENHFSIINDNLRSLMNRKKPKKQVAVEPKIVKKERKELSKEVSIVALQDFFNNYTKNMNDSFYEAKLSINTLNDWIDQEQQPDPVTHVPSTPEPEPETPAHIIPEKFRKKKLPYLDKHIKTGYLKFFDEKNHFGFMMLNEEPFGEVFIFGKEFEKANIDRNLIAMASNNPDIVFKFRVMYYKGKHGESKKAVNLRI